ncbi:hypothetical protein [Paraburkholderia adhaesiva]|uniref:hypothetical protein n=1 Tax=Paraburkholderia adhaesiva TaxID=2883244 RepID=UPI001F35CEE8|nr:hypothetical protein [Paraburkholderia adhaesiva]
MGIFDRLFGTRPKSVPETPQIRALIERLLVLSPSLRLADGFRERVTPALARSIDHVSRLVSELPQAREASASTWLDDPYIHAFFAAADEVAHILSRSPDLHAWFENHSLARETFAVLGMAMTERRVFGVEQVGDTVHADVVRTTLSFDDHQVRVCGETEADLRVQIVQRVVEQIALEGLAQISADESRRDALVQERALLKTRLQLLTRHGAGTHKMLGEHALSNAAERIELEAAIEANERDISALGLKTDALAHELDVICDVLSHPERHTNVEMKRYRLNAMNVVIDGSAAPDGSEIVFPLAQLPASPLVERAFSLVRFARSDLVPLPSVLDKDSRFVI